MQLEFYYLHIIIYRKSIFNKRISTCDHMCDKSFFYTIIMYILSHMLLSTYMLTPECECDYSSFFCRIRLSFMVIQFFILTNW